MYLGNVHLSQLFMHELEYMIDNIQLMQNPSPDFKLFISTKPNPNIPISILQKCLKLSTEQPHGIKNNMAFVYDKLVPDKLNANEQLREHQKYKKILFAISWFHSLINERNKFKHLGWNVAYNFNDVDF